MTEEKFYIQSIFYDILTNGFRDDINNNPERLGFILGAVDNGFSISNQGRKAKYGKIEIFLRLKRDTDNLMVSVFKGSEKQCEMDYSKDGFMWYKTEIKKGRLFIEGHGFICSTT